MTGQTGELLLRGPLIFAGYWNNDPATASTSIEGWLHTGDLAVRDGDGYYWIVDRKKDMIISGGLNVYPAEVEKEMTGISDIAGCAVYGVPDEAWGERVVAAIELIETATLDPAGIQARLRQELAAYKVPKQIFVVDRLPRTTSGKVQKRKLREAHALATASAGAVGQGGVGRPR